MRKAWPFWLVALALYAQTYIKVSQVFEFVGLGTGMIAYIPGQGNTPAKLAIVQLDGLTLDMGTTPPTLRASQAGTPFKLEILDASSTLAGSPIGSCWIFRNGILQREGTDYTRIGRTVTLVTRVSGDYVTAIYQ